MKWYLEMGGSFICKDKKGFTRNIKVSYNEISQIREKFNNTDVYATVFQYDKEDQNESNLYGPLYIDLDMDFNDEESYSKLREDLKRIVTYLNMYYKIPTNYMKFYFTGKKGFHILIPAKVFNIKPNNDLNVYFKEIAKELNENTVHKIVDTRIYDKKRLLRLPNSINSKTGLYKVPIFYDDILKFNYDDIQEYASCPKKITVDDTTTIKDAENKFLELIQSLKDRQAKRTTKFILPTNVNLEKVKFPSCIQKIYREGCQEGIRNNTTIILASAFFQKGLPKEKVMKLMQKWNTEKNYPSLADNELEITVDSAYQQVMNGRRYGCLSIKDIGLCVGKECPIYR